MTKAGFIPVDCVSSALPEDRGAGPATLQFAGLVDRLTSLTPIGPASAPHSLEVPYGLRADKHCSQSSNLYGLEYDDRGTCFRWSGPSELLRFRISISSSVNWRIHLRFISTSDARNPASIELFVDGNPVDLSRTELSGMWLLSSEPVRVQARKVNDIAYHVPHLSSPRAKDPLSVDGRRLGIAWFDLRLQPQGLGASAPAEADR